MIQQKISAQKPFRTKLRIKQNALTKVQFSIQMDLCAILAMFQYRQPKYS